VTTPGNQLPRLYTELGVTPAAPVVPAGTLILDDPALGLLDTGTLCGATSWTDTGSFVRTLSVVRPGSRSQGPLFTYQAATLSAVFDNADGRFDPDNLAGPYVAGGVSQVRAMIPFRVRASWNGTDYQLISVHADGWQPVSDTYDDGYSEVTLTGTDAFKVLTGIILATVGAAGSGETSGARITRILNAAGWYSDHRRIATGDSTVQATTFGSDALTLLQLTADTELGELYMDGAGNLTFRDRHAILTDARSSTPQGVFGDVPGTVHPAGTELACEMPARANDDTTMFNDIQITAAGSANLQESVDSASVALNLFPRTFARTDLILTSDFEALAYAQWVKTVAKNADDRFDTLVIDPLADPVNLWPQVLGRERGDRIEVWRRPQSQPPVVTLFGSQFPPAIASAVVSATGHTFNAVPVPGWGFGAGVAVFYTAPLPGGQIAITTVPLTENELQPTADHAEIGIFRPKGPGPGSQNAFARLVIPTSNGSLTAVEPGHAIGGTDAGGGDMAIVGGRPVFTCQGYYFNWSIPGTGLYPALGFLQNLAFQWAYDPVSSLTGDAWEATNPTAFATLQPGGISTGVGANYWSPRSPGQMAVLPNSGRLVTGHYFGTGSFTGGAISVSDANGNLLAAYQLPNIVPTDGTTLTTCAVRDVQADPSSAVNDERIVVIYDFFGTGNIQGCFQEFSYNESTKVIAPVTVPTCPADTTGGSPNHVRPSFALFGPDGTLYISCGNGLGSANMSVYLKHGGGRNTQINAPVFGGWPTASWPTPVGPDYSLGFPVALGLGALAGPMAIDPASGAVLVPAGSGHVAAAVPSSGGITSLGPNLLSALAAGFETPNVLTDDDATFTTSLGSWVPFVSVLSRSTSPPVTPPRGTSAGQMTTFAGAMTCNSGFYPVTAGLNYLLNVDFLAATVARTMECWIQWQNSGGGVISPSAHGTGADNTTTWTGVSTGQVTAPSGAARAVLFVQGDAVGAGEVHYFAANALYCLDATPTGWGGFATTIALSSDQALDGTFSLALTSPFTSTTLVAISPKVPVTAGREYLAKASFRAKTTSEPCKITIAFQDINGANIGFPADGTLNGSDSSSGWAEARCGALAPQGSVTAQLNLEPAAAAIGEVHYADRVSFQAQPWTVPPGCDFGLGMLRSAGYAASSGRPTVSGGYLYIPVATTFTPAEQAAYGTSYIPDTAHPQFLAAVNIAELLAGNYGAVVKDCFIRGIEHDVDAVAGTWQTTWTLQDATRYAGFLVLDSLATGFLDTDPMAY
jgi:hypothetical protein